MKDQKVTIKYVIAVFGVVLITWIIHEFAHWLTYTLQGFDAYMGLNKAGIRGGETPNIDQQILGAAAGPLITLVQAFLAFWYLNKKGWSKYVYAFLFTAFYMRFLAGLMNFISPNDEGFIGLQLGLGLFTVAILVVLILFYWMYQTHKQYKIRWQFNGWTLFLVMIASSFVILVDQFFMIRLL